VALSWNPSSSFVIGYNVYRASQSGGPYTRLNSSLQAGTTYTDSGVASGTTYFYVTTAVDGNSQESAFSNETTSVIPNL
jgi:fibronectin type 3 domain-containing protein